MKKSALIALALAMASTAVQAANISSTVGGGLWSATTTWTGGVVPGTVGAPGADIARIVNGSLVTLNSAVPIAMGNVQIGRTTGGAGNLEVTTGGVLNMALSSNMEVGSQTVGTLLLSGGTINVLSALNITAAAGASGSSVTVNSGNLNVGTTLAVGKFANGTLMINGGSVVANAMPVGTVGIDSSASLLGGSLQLGALLNPLTFNSAGSTLTIANAATLTLGGDKTTEIAGFAGINLLWATGSSTLGGLYGTGDQSFDNGFGSYLHSFFDAGTTKTYVWVDTVAPVPEPTTLSLALLSGLGLLVGRRSKRS